MFTLLKIGNVGLRKVRDYGVTLTNVSGKGAGITENGNEIMDVRCRNKAVISVTFAELTKDEFNYIMTALDAETVELTYFCGYYKTALFKVDDRAFTLLSNENRRNTEDYNKWDLSVQFTQIKMEADNV